MKWMLVGFAMLLAGISCTRESEQRPITASRPPTQPGAENEIAEPAPEEPNATERSKQQDDCPPFVEPRGCLDTGCPAGQRCDTSHVCKAENCHCGVCTADCTPPLCVPVS